MPTPVNQPTAAQAKANQATAKPPRESATQPVEFIEFGLGLELLLDSFPIFADAVQAALHPFGGEFLFELPYAGKPDGKGRVAAVRFAYGGDPAPRVVFAFLSDDAMDTDIRPADGQVEHLKDFAQSFVDVLEKIERH
jgi:hypothetical protein